MSQHTINFLVAEISVEDLLQAPEREVNEEIWDQCVQQMSGKESAIFYVSRPSQHRNYTQYFVSYKQEGILFFEPFNPFLQPSTDRGFRMIHIDEYGNVSVVPFLGQRMPDGYLPDTDESRDIIRKKLTPFDLKVSKYI